MLNFYLSKANAPSLFTRVSVPVRIRRYFSISERIIFTQSLVEYITIHWLARPWRRVDEATEYWIVDWHDEQNWSKLGHIVGRYLDSCWFWPELRTLIEVRRLGLVSLYHAYAKLFRQCQYTIKYKRQRVWDWHVLITWLLHSLPQYILLAFIFSSDRRFSSYVRGQFFIDMFYTFGIWATLIFDIRIFSETDVST